MGARSLPVRQTRAMLIGRAHRTWYVVVPVLATLFTAACGDGSATDARATPDSFLDSRSTTGFPSPTYSSSPASEELPPALPAATASTAPGAAAELSAEPVSGTLSPATPWSAANLVEQIPECSKGDCRIRAELTTTGTPTLGFALVRMPGETDAIEEPFKMALFDIAGQKLTWASEVIHGMVAGAESALATQDKRGHIAVTLGAGAHSTLLYVLDPRDGVQPKFFGYSGEGKMPSDTPGYWTNTPNAAAEDQDGDGRFELYIEVSDYEPDYVNGKRTVYVYRWNGEDYERSQCNVRARDALEDTHNCSTPVG